MGRKSRLKAARRAERTGKGGGSNSGSSDSGSSDDGGVFDSADGVGNGGMVEINLGGGNKIVGAGDAMREAVASAAADLKAARANAAAENQKAEAPCDACGHTMQAAERCASCRKNGVWYCSACHAWLEGRTGVGAAA